MKRTAVLAFVLLLTTAFPAVFGAEPVQPEEAAPVAPSSASDFLKDDSAYRSLMEFLTALSIIKNTYVDADKVTYERLFKAALTGMLHELDPYSTYETAEIYRETQEESKGEMAGIGVVISMRNHVLEIVEIQKDGPAFKAGLKPGDLIMEIDGQGLNGKTMKDAVRMLRGKKGESVRLLIYRASTDKKQEYTLVRDQINLPTVTGERVIDKASGIAYVRVAQFGGKTANELETAIRKLQGEGMTSLVIDLRNNPGGLVIAAVKVCSLFLPEDDLIVSLEGRDGGKKETYRSLKCRKYTDLPLALLVNGNSASASEIVTACLQSHKRAVVIGERTFGKGVVQTLMPFGSKEALRVTTAKYYAPDRRVIHEKGVDPDIQVPLTAARRAAISVRMNTHPGEIEDRVPGGVRDTQLERAVEVLKAVQLFRNAHKK